MIVADELYKQIIEEFFTNDYFSSDVVSTFGGGFSQIVTLLATDILSYFVFLSIINLSVKYFADWKEGIFCASAIKNDFFTELFTLMFNFLTGVYSSLLILVASNQKINFKTVAIAVCVSVLMVSVQNYLIPILENAGRLGIRTSDDIKLLKNLVEKLKDKDI